MRHRRECCLYTKNTVAGCPFLPQIFQCTADLLALRTLDAATDGDFHATFCTLPDTAAARLPMPPDMHPVPPFMRPPHPCRAAIYIKFPRSANRNL